MSARGALRKYVSLLADWWTPPSVTEERVERLYGQVRAEVLRQEAHEIVAFCPEHGDRDTCWPECHCPVAEDMLSRVAAQGETDGAR